MKILEVKRAGAYLAASLLLMPAINLQAQVKAITANKTTAERPLPFDPAVRTGKLANGFTYYIRHNEEPKNRAVIYLANKAGSVLEDEDQRGLAHFMEHMNFNGTTHFPKNQLIDYLQKAGVRFGADLNAYTSFDETVYQLPLPTDKPEILANGLLIMHDWAHGATLDPTEIDKERGVVLEEKRMGKGAGERMAMQYYPTLFNHSRYAERLPIGLENVLNTFKPSTIRRFYEDWYRPDLQALIIVGDVNVDDMEGKVKVQFADLKNPVKEKPRTKYNIELNGKNQFIAVTDKEMPYTQAQIFIKQKNYPVNNEARLKESILEEIFNRVMRGRLSEISQVENPPFIGGTIGIDGFLAGIKDLNASVTARPGELENGLKAVWREVLRAKKFGITQTEFDRAKANSMQLLETALKEKNKTASDKFVKAYVEYFLRGEVPTDIDYRYEASKRILASISVADLNQIVNAAVKQGDRDILIMAPEKDKAQLPDETTVLSWLKEVSQEDIAAYKDDVSDLPLLKKQPIPGKIIKEVKDDRLGSLNLTLSNGVKVILKPTDYKNDDINIYGIEPHGSGWYPDSLVHTAMMAGEIYKYGAGNYNTRQERKYLAGKQATVVVSMDEKYQQIGASTRNSDLATTLELIYAHVTEPRLDIEQFKGGIKSQIAAMANDADNPHAVFMDTMIAASTNHNPRRRRAKPADLEKIDINKTFEIYKEGFSDASDFTFFFIGSIDTTTVKPLIEKYLGSLPSTYQHKGYKDLGYHPAFGQIQRTVYMGKAPRAAVQMCFPGKFDYNYKNVLVMDAMREALQIKITERLREKESGAYSPQVLAGGTSVAGGWEQVIIQFYCAPENVDKLIAAAKDEISNIIKNGPSETDLAKFKAEENRTLEVKQKNNSYWSTYFGLQVRENTDFHDVLDHDQIVNAITANEVKKAAALYFNGENYTQFVLMPDKK